MGLEGHHGRFRTLCRVDASAWGVQEHFQLTMMLRHALQVDQLNGYNLMSVEVMFRRMQTIEYAYAEKAREMEAKAIGANWPSKSSRCSVTSPGTPLLSWCVRTCWSL